jgi:hypothetical protein
MNDGPTPAKVRLNDELGPLPPPTCGGAIVPSIGLIAARAIWTAYSAADMRAYAAQEVAAERERCAALCDELDNSQNTNEYRAAARWAAVRIRGA